jgi:hypothetical protein
MLVLSGSGARICLGLHFNILVLLPFSMLGAGGIFVMVVWGQDAFDSAGNQSESS